jgi:hypothetical protein
MVKPLTQSEMLNGGTPKMVGFPLLAWIQQETMAVISIHPHAYISLIIPKLTKGVLTLENNPKLRLSYSRSIYASSSDDHFTAFADQPGSNLEVTITDSGAKSGWLKGRFSGKAVTLPAKSVSITEGVFCVRLNQQGEGEKTQPKGSGHILHESLPHEVFQFAFRTKPPISNITEFTLRFDLD